MKPLPQREEKDNHIDREQSYQLSAIENGTRLTGAKHEEENSLCR
jgi:hypothetical protein